MAILLPGWPDFSWQVRLQMCRKFCAVKVADCMGSPNEQYNIFEIVLLVWALVQFVAFTIQNFRRICSRTFQLESSHLGNKIAVTLPIFTFRSCFVLNQRLCRITTRVFLDHL